MEVLEVIGPNNYSPGDILSADQFCTYSKEGIACAEHKTVRATKILIGESDSMGSEVTPMCEECLKKHQEHVQNNPDEYVRHCEKCDSTDNVRGKRDPDEGMAGPVYMWCRRCRADFDKAYADANPPDEDEDFHHEPNDYDFEHPDYLVWREEHSSGQDD